jgi:photosystem II stability/assembly factor-like uncharacterized protein
MIYFNPTRSTYANYIEMFSPEEGIAMGDAFRQSGIPLFLKTTDGINWVETNKQVLGGGTSDGQFGVDFADPNTGYYSPKGGPNPRWLCKTTDGGYTWKETDFGIYANVLRFYDKDYGIVVKMPDAYRTTNGGKSWESYPITSATLYPARGIEFVPGRPNQIWLSSVSGIFFSSDSGKTWIEYTPLKLTDGLEIVFTSQKHGWMIGHYGKVYYTDNNGGIVTGVEDNEAVPAGFDLFRNYPNPFNPGTTISYKLGEPSYVTIKIYNQLGQLISIIKNEYEQAGYHQVVFNGSGLASGIYFYTLEANRYYQTRPMLLIK